MPAVSVAEPGWRTLLLDEYYKPFPKQEIFHRNPRKYRLFGGAAGPGKSLAMIYEGLMQALEHESRSEGRQVHILALRRTNAELKRSLIARFLEKVPSELYVSFNETDRIVTFPNGADLTFGGMEHPTDWKKYQGTQYKRILWDELTQFEYHQWSMMSAWNRCPVAFAGMDGASNPIGVGSLWVKSMFVDKRPAAEMKHSPYNPNEYAFIPAVVSDNPIYANDTSYLETLNRLPGHIRAALLEGKWDAAVGAFYDIWNPAEHVYPADSVKIEPWWPRWISMDWGFEHDSAIQWHCSAPNGKHYTYREHVANHLSPGQLAEVIAEKSAAERIEEFHLSHDAFAQRTDADTIAVQMWNVLKDYKIEGRTQFAPPTQSTKDVLGSSMLLYDLLREGEWQIADTCERLINTFPMAGRDEKNPEELAKFTGDDPLCAARYGLYGRLRSRKPPVEVRVQDRIAEMAKISGVQLTGTDLHLATLKARREEAAKGKPIGARRFRPGAWKN